RRKCPASRRCAPGWRSSSPLVRRAGYLVSRPLWNPYSRPYRDRTPAARLTVTGRHPLSDHLPAEGDDEEAPEKGAEQRLGDHWDVHPALGGAPDVAETRRERRDARQRGDHPAVRERGRLATERGLLDVQALDTGREDGREPQHDQRGGDQGARRARTIAAA